MKPTRREHGVLLSVSRWNLFDVGRVVLLLTAGAALAMEARAAALSLSAELVGNGPSVRIVVRGEPGMAIRLESSSTLASWQSSTVLENPTGTVTFVDQDGPAVASRFYRASALDPPALQVTIDAVPGGVFDLPGAFSEDLPGELLVRFGTIDAEVIGLTAGGVRVRVPPTAVSGVVTVRGIDGVRTSAGLEVVVAAPGPVRFQPPPGISPSSFRLMNAYGVAPGSATNMTLRRERPLINLALPVDTNRPSFFLAVSVTDQETTAIDAASTVQALIFLSPLFNTTDPHQARRLFDHTRQNPKVQTLATLFSEIVLAGGDPLSSEAFEQAYIAAVLSVLKRPNLVGAAGTSRVRRAKRQDDAALPQWIDDADTDYLAVSHGPGILAVASEPINHLDWVVTVSRVDVAEAFPGGRDEFRAAVEKPVMAGQDEYALLKGFRESFIVRASPLLEGADISGLIGQLVGRRFGLSDDPRGQLALTNTPALYVVRGVSPAFDPESESAFAQAHYHSAYLASVRLNLLAAAVDLLSAASPIPGTSGALGKLSAALEKALSGLDTLPPIDSPGSFLGEASELAAQFSFEFGMTHLAESSPAGAGAAGQAMGRISGSLRWIGKTVAKLFDPIDKGVDVGKAVLRAYGVFKATPLETAFVEVGDVFQLQILEVKPGTGAIGDTINILVSGRRFGRSGEADAVWFAQERVQVPRADVQVVDAPDGNQTIRVKVPERLGELFAAAPDKEAFSRQPIVVTAGGFRGTAPFVYLDRPTVTSMEPLEGFAASAAYLGSPFPGTAVRLRGFGFGPEDRFFFHQTEVTNRSGSQGDVTLLVPAGATSGRIEVVPDPPGAGKAGFSPFFKVLGPPVLVGEGPVSGPVGTTVRLRVDNLGLGPATLTLKGQPLNDVRLFLGEIAGVVSFGSQSGPLQVLTPAGMVEYNFTVEPGPAPGSIVAVNSSAIPSLQRAVDLAGHVGGALWTKGCTVSLTCIDDLDVDWETPDLEVRGLDPPVPNTVAEEGDFITDEGLEAVPRFRIGKEYADFITVSGRIAGNVIMGTNNLFETISGTNDGGEILKPIIEGDVTVTGSFNHLVNLIILGKLVIAGDNNVVEGVLVTGSSDMGVLVQGNGNLIKVSCLSNRYDGLVIDGGSLNRVEVLSTANGGNGVTLKGGARGNQVSLTTGLLPTPMGLVPGRGNNAHGIALLQNASENLVVGLGPIARNQADGAYLSGSGVVSNRFVIFLAQSNGGNGFNVRDRAQANVLDGVVAEANGDSGFVIREATGTTLQRIRSGFNGKAGVQLIGVTNLNGAATFETRGNLAVGLRMEAGSRGLVLEGTSVADARGLELIDATTLQNKVSLLIDAPTGDGALVREASQNELALRIKGGGGAGLVVESGANQNQFPGLWINACLKQGLILRDAGTVANRFPDVQVGVPLQGEPAGNGSDGVLIENGATDNQFGDLTGLGPTVRNNGGVGIRVRGATTLGNRILNAQIHEDVGVGRIQQSGLVIEAGVTRMLLQGATITGHPGSGLELNQAPVNEIGALLFGAKGNLLARNGVGLKLAGRETIACRAAGNIIVQNGIGVVIESQASRNEIGTDNIVGDNGTGVRLDQASQNRIFETVIRDNSGAGLLLVNGARDNLIRTNRVLRNGVGVEVTGNGTVGNRLTLNSITANAGQGIRLTLGGNRQLEAPTITSVGSQRVTGWASVDDGGTVELFADPADEGERFLGSGVVVRGEWVVAVNLRPGDVGRRYHLHATVTDSLGDTSEFGDSDSTGGVTPVVLVSTRDGNRELYLLSGIDESQVRLTTHPAADHSPSLAPAGGSLVFVSLRDGPPTLYRLSLGGTNPVTRLITQGTTDYDPTWRPDGGGLAFVSERDGNPEIYASGVDGTGAMRLTTNAAPDRWPSFSPDGARIVFASRQSSSDSNWELWMMNADGTNLRSLAPHSADDTQPTWSPDGTRIAFVSERDGNPELYVIRPDGSDLQRATHHPAEDVDPAWLPDSQALLFSSNRDAGFELYEVSVAAGLPNRITVNQGDNTQPRAGR